MTRSIHEGARDLARDLAKTDAYVTSRRERKKVEMLFAHLKLDRLRLRGPNGAKDEFLLAVTAQDLRKLAKLIPMPPSRCPHNQGGPSRPCPSWYLPRSQWRVFNTIGLALLVAVLLGAIAVTFIRLVSLLGKQRADEFLMLREDF